MVPLFFGNVKQVVVVGEQEFGFVRDGSNQ
jgi:hypothetical protein